MQIPNEVKNILNKLQAAGFEAYAVGGCVRDLLLDKKPKDWDVCTNALPEKIQQVFSESFYENKFGTVSVRVNSPAILLKEGDNPTQPPLKLRGGEGGVMQGAGWLKENISKDNIIEFVEVTTYRMDAKYTDKRHPDSVSFTPNLEEDLARRDFTINAIALMESKKATPPLSPAAKAYQKSKIKNEEEFKIIDPFKGQEDLKNGIIRAVGEPDKRLNEDALRMLRAVRFVVELSSVEQNFVIESKTKEAVKKNAGWLQAIAKERVRDEFVKIILSSKPEKGILLLHDLGLLQYVIPELEKGVSVGQNKHHIYTIFEHSIFSLKFAAQKNFNLVVRLAALLHDVAKPQAKRGEGLDSTFYNHDIMGAHAAARILERLRFDNDTIERVANLIRHHMFVYDIGAVTEAGVRRLLARVGPDNMKELIDLRIADRLGSGVPKAQPYRLRHFQYMVDKVQNDPISVEMLKINGNDLMEVLKIEPGPKIGAILDVFLAEVIEDAKKNDKNFLLEHAKQLNEIDLTQLRQMAKERIEEEKEEEDKVIKGRYWVK